MTPIRKGLILAASVLADAVEEQLDQVCKSYFAAMRLEETPGIPEEEAAVLVEVSDARRLSVRTREQIEQAIATSARYGADAKQLIEIMLRCQVDGSVVYFVQAGKLGPVKIGTTTDINARLLDLQCANPDKLTLLGTLPGNADTERALHQAFAAHNIRGEWFRPASQLMIFIARLFG